MNKIFKRVSKKKMVKRTPVPSSVPLATSVCGPAQELPPADCLDVYEIDPSMFAENRARVLDRFKNDSTVPPNSVLLFESGKTEERHDTDHEKIFRQESNFAYLFGVKEPDCYATIEVDSGKATVFFPRLPENYAVWMGKIRSLDSFKEEYALDEAKYVDELKDTLTAISPKIVYTTRGYNPDSGRYAAEAKFDGIEEFRVDNGKLYADIVECRVVKTEKELKLMRHINKITSQAHLWVMANTRPGMQEFQQESMFLHWGYFRGGCRHQSYTSICGSGENGAVLHYGHAGCPNWKIVQENDMCLLDQGAEYRCYTSDITCSFPANGKFTEDQRAIYETVFECQTRVFEAMKPGVCYIDMHELTYRVICERLTKIGILKGDVEEMMAANIGAVFMPHGLGHFMGLDTHDVGGRVNTPKQTRDGFKSLRCCRVLQKNQVLTVEPGVYFNDYSLDKALANPEQAKFINPEVLDRFRGFGGVRLEDDVIVTETGIENMSRVPRTIADVEAVMAGKITDLNQLECPFTPKF